MAKWQYGVVIDAGSSGSRVHVYRWKTNSRALEDADADDRVSLPHIKTDSDWTYKTKPGISTFSTKIPQVGPDHLHSLLKHALDVVPKDQVKETPIFLLATAGVRLLDPLPQKALLDEVCRYIQTESKFLLEDCGQHIQVISGDAEGLYGWLAANYLLGGFDKPKEHDHGKGHHTYGFLDMGGASAQIAFAPNMTEAEKHANDLKLVRLRTIDGAAQEYQVFVTTWLGFGVRQARLKYVENLVQSMASVNGEYPDPCLPVGLTLNTAGDLLTPDKVMSETVHLVGTGKFKECLAASFPLLEKDMVCDDPPCLFSGVHVPAIDFDVNHFVGVSEYWHTTHEVFEMGHKDKAYDFTTYQARVEEFCSRNWSDIQKDLEQEKWGKKVTEATAADICFRANWLINVLHDGIGIPRVALDHVDHKGTNATLEIINGAKKKGFLDPFQAINKIDDTEVSWTLGRMVLYAASEVPPRGINSMPVGFGTNIKDTVPKDFQYAGLIDPITRLPRPIPITDTSSKHDTDDDSLLDKSMDTLFSHKTQKRLPGLILFLTILIIALYLLCGRDRRSKLLRRIWPARFISSRGNYLKLNTRDRDRDRLMESGLTNPEDFELGSVSSRSPSPSLHGNGRTSGWATPKIDGNGVKEGVNPMERIGLSVRSESMEVLKQVPGRRSRIASPIRGRHDND